MDQVRSFVQTNILPLILLEDRQFVQEAYTRILLRRPSEYEAYEITGLSIRARYLFLIRLADSEEAHRLNAKLVGVRILKILIPVFVAPFIGNGFCKLTSYFFYAHSYGFFTLLRKFIQSKDKMGKVKQFLIKLSSME